MTLEDYKEMEPEIYLHAGDYEEQGNRSIPLHGKWLGFSIREGKKLRKMQQKMKTLLHERSNYYLGKTDEPYEHVVLKTDLSRYLAADPMIQEYEDLLGDQEDVVTYINKIITKINERGFTLRNNLQAAQWEAGQNPR